MVGVGGPSPISEEKKRGRERPKFALGLSRAPSKGSSPSKSFARPVGSADSSKLLSSDSRLLPLARGPGDWTECCECPIRELCITYNSRARCIERKIIVSLRKVTGWTHNNVGESCIAVGQGCHVKPLRAVRDPPPQTALDTIRKFIQDNHDGLAALLDDMRFARVSWAYQGIHKAAVLIYLPHSSISCQARIFERMVIKDEPCHSIAIQPSNDHLSITKKFHYSFISRQLLRIPRCTIVPSWEGIRNILVVRQLIWPGLLDDSHHLCEVECVCNVGEMQTYTFISRAYTCVECLATYHHAALALGRRSRESPSSLAEVMSLSTRQHVAS